MLLPSNEKAAAPEEERRMAQVKLGARTTRKASEISFQQTNANCRCQRAEELSSYRSRRQYEQRGEESHERDLARQAPLCRRDGKKAALGC